jgi:hypothetical protein
MPVTVMADGKEYELGYGVWMLQNGDRFGMEKLFEKTAEDSPNTVMSHGHSAREFTDDLNISDLEEALQNMGWVFQDEVINTIEGPLLNWRIREFELFKKRSYPKVIIGDELKSSLYSEVSLPEDMVGLEYLTKFIGRGCSSPSLLKRKLVSKLEPTGIINNREGGGAFRGANIVADYLSSKKMYGHNLVFLLDPTDSFCHDEIDSAMLTIMQMQKDSQDYSTIVVNDYVGKKSPHRSLSVHRPYFNTLWIGYPEEISISVE